MGISIDCKVQHSHRILIIPFYFLKNMFLVITITVLTLRLNKLDISGRKSLKFETILQHFYSNCDLLYILCSFSKTK